MRRRRARPDDPQVVTDLVRALGGLLGELGLSEIEVDRGSTRVRVSRATSGVSSPAAPNLPPVAQTPSSGGVTVEAPMVGTFYRASAPTAEPYVREGDVVKEGQILCIIEAMKLMNEVEARAAGRIAEILVENGQPVEYGQPLFRIEPSR